MQIDVFARGDLPISFASDRFKRKFGLVGRFDLLTNWVVDSRAFVQWVTSRTDAIFSGLQQPGVEEFGQLAIVRRSTQEGDGKAEPEPRMIAALFPEPRGPRHVYRVSVRICASTADSRIMPDCVMVPGSERVPDKIVMPSPLPPGRGASGKTMQSL